MGILLLLAVGLLALGGMSSASADEPAQDAEAWRAVYAFSLVYPTLLAEVKSGQRPSLVVERVQRAVGLNPDGYLGKDTTYVLRNRYGWNPDGPMNPPPGAQLRTGSGLPKE